MGQALNRLSARKIATLRTPGRHADGGGLYAAVSKTGARRWVFLFRWRGQRHEMGLGSLDAVPLAKAREKAAGYRLEIASGQNPLELRRANDIKSKLTELDRSFGSIADQLIEARSPGWRNEKHQAQWRMTLKEYAGPLRERDVAEITTDDVLSVLQPIWVTKPETASRTRGRIEAVIDSARVRGVIEESAVNPARWRGHLDHLLPKQPRLVRGHHAALPWKELPAFMKDLRSRQAPAARALEWCILNAARLGEALGTRWQEIDFEQAIWTCPAERMKGGRVHRVPLSSASLDLLHSMQTGMLDDLIFPSRKPEKPLSNMAVAALYKRMGLSNITTHGFRSSFRDWAGEVTDHPREVCEAALAHSVGSSVERAYRREDALEKRRSLMQDWGTFCFSNLDAKLE